MSVVIIAVMLAVASNRAWCAIDTDSNLQSNVVSLACIPCKTPKAQTPLVRFVVDLLWTLLIYVQQV